MLQTGQGMGVAASTQTIGSFLEAVFNLKYIQKHSLARR